MGQRGRPRHPDLLTPREQDVLALLRDNLTNEQIAERLGISFETAKHHVGEILSKLGVSSREQAAAWQPERRRISFGRILFGSAGIASVVAAIVGIVLLALGAFTGGVGDGTASRGAEILFSRNGALLATNPDGSSTRTITSVIPATFVYIEASPDGQSIAFVAGATGFDNFGGHVYIVGSNGSGLKEIDEVSNGGVIGGCLGRWLAWSPDSSVLAHTWIGEGELHLTDRNGLPMRSIDGGSNPSWSRDGHLAYNVIGLKPTGDGNFTGVCNVTISNANGDAIEELGEGETPVWSPDGHTIAVTTSSDVRLIDVDSGESTVVYEIELPIIESVKWSHDGAFLSFRPASDDTTIIDVASGEVETILNATGATWSPTDNRLAYSGNFSIFVTSDGNFRESARIADGETAAWLPPSE